MDDSAASGRAMAGGETGQNGTSEPLPRVREEAAQLCADDALSDEAISTKVGIGRQTLVRWRKLPEFQARIAYHKAEFAEHIRREGIANRQNRIDAYNRRWELLERIREERAADEWLADVPGGGTGFVVKQLKTVKHHYLPDPDDEDGRPSQALVETWESAVDTGFLAEFRHLEKHAAQDAGQWAERSELTGKDGGPLEINEVEIVRTVTTTEAT